MSGTYRDWEIKGANIGSPVSVPFEVPRPEPVPLTQPAEPQTLPEPVHEPAPGEPDWEPRIPDPQPEEPLHVPDPATLPAPVHEPAPGEPDWEPRMPPEREPSEEPIRIPDSPERRRVPARRQGARGPEGEMVGWRYGIPEKDGDGLWKFKSPIFKGSWPRGDVQADTSHCQAGEPGHRAPHEGHGCGLYAFYDEDMADMDVPAGSWVTKVTGWGRVQPHQKGFRSEFMRVTGIRKPQCSHGCGRPATRMSGVAHYGVGSPQLEGGASPAEAMVHREMARRDAGPMEIEAAAPYCDEHGSDARAELRGGAVVSGLGEAPAGSKCNYWRCNRPAAATAGYDRGVPPGPRCVQHLPEVTMTHTVNGTPVDALAGKLSEYYGAPVLERRGRQFHPGTRP